MIGFSEIVIILVNYQQTKDLWASWAEPLIGSYIHKRKFP